MFRSKKTKDINLIPESETSSGLEKAVLPLILFGVIIGVTVAAGLFLLFLNSQAQAKAKEQEDQIAVKNSEWQKVASAAATTSQIKNKLGSYQTFVTKYPPLENYIATIGKHLPEDVTLTSLDVDNSGVVRLQAKTTSSESAYQFTEVFSNTANVFSNVKIAGVSRDVSSGEYTISLTMVVAK